MIFQRVEFDPHRTHEVRRCDRVDVLALYDKLGRLGIIRTSGIGQGEGLVPDGVERRLFYGRDFFELRAVDAQRTPRVGTPFPVQDGLVLDGQMPPASQAHTHFVRRLLGVLVLLGLCVMRESFDGVERRTRDEFSDAGNAQKGRNLSQGCSTTPI